MAKSYDKDELIEAFKEALKGSSYNQEVVREVKNLSGTLREYVEKAQGNVNIEKVFTQLTQEFTKSIDKSIQDQQKAGEKTLDTIRQKYEDLTKQINQLEQSKDFIEDYEKKLDKLVKEQKKTEEKFAEEQQAQNEAIKKSVRESQKKLVEELTTGMEEFSSTAFKKQLSETKDIDESLKKYKQALREQYELLEKDAETRKKLGVTDNQMELIKEELYDSYLSELEYQKSKKNLDEKTRKVLEEKYKRERIMAGKSTYEQTYGDRSSIAQLAGRLADITTKRFKEQDDKTNTFSKAITGGLGALFKGKNAKQPFLEPENPEAKVSLGITSSDVEGGEKSNYLKGSITDKGSAVPTPEAEAAEERQVQRQEQREERQEQRREQREQRAEQQKAAKEKEEINVTPEKEPPTYDVEAINPSKSQETLESIQQIFEEARENVPFKVDIENISTPVKKTLTDSFVDAIREIMAPMANQATQKAIGDGTTKPKKKEKDGSIIDVDDLNNLGFFKKAARGIGKAARGVGRFATGGVGLGGLLGTNVGAIGSLGAGAVLTSTALAAGTAYGGFKAGEALEENFGLGTKTLEAVGVNKKENEIEKAQDELNGKLQEAAKIKDPTQKRVARSKA